MPTINLRFFSDLLVLPLRALLLLPASFDEAFRDRIRRWIWNVTGDTADALGLVRSRYPGNRREGRALLEELAVHSRDCAHVALLCDLDFQTFHDVLFVREWIERAQRDEYSNQFMLVHLELLLCDPRRDPRLALDLSGTVLDRGDYPPRISYTALCNRMIAYVSLGELDKAEEIVDRVSAVATDNGSLFLRMILRYARGEDDVEDLLDKMVFRDRKQRELMLVRARIAGGREEPHDL